METIPRSSDGAPLRPVRLTYVAPADCPDLDAFSGHVRARSSNTSFEFSSSGATPDSVDVQVEASADAMGWVGRVRIDGALPLERDVRSERCEDVVEALALITVLRLEGGASRPSAVASPGSSPGPSTSEPGAVPGAAGSGRARESASNESGSETAAAAERAPNVAPEAEPPATAPIPAEAPPTAPAVENDEVREREAREREVREREAREREAREREAREREAREREAREREAREREAREREARERDREGSEEANGETSAAADETGADQSASESTPWQWPSVSAAVAVRAGYASVPSHAYKALLQGELRFGQDMSSWASTLTLAYARGTSESDAAELDVRLLGADLALCPPAFIDTPGVWLRACALARAGAVHVLITSTDPSRPPGDVWRPWLAVAPSLEIGVPLSQRWSLRGAFDLAVQLVRDRFSVSVPIDETGTERQLTVYRPEPLSVEMGIGLGYSF